MMIALALRESTLSRPRRAYNIASADASHPIEIAAAATIDTE